MWFVAESDYPGLNTEAPTLDVFVERVREVLDDLHELNAEPAGQRDLVLSLLAA